MCVLSKKNLIYHYTGVKAAESILNQQCIRLMHCEGLKDTTEGKYILIMLKKDLRGYKEIYDTMTSNLYIGCFCPDGNSSYLWKEYGEINIGFDSAFIKNGCRFIRDKDGTHHDTSGTQFAVCEYTSTEDETYINVLQYVKNKLGNINFESIQSQQFAYLSCNQAFCLKPVGYIDENEYRIVSHLWNRNPFETYRDGKRKKYIEFKFTPDKVKTIAISQSPETDEYKNRIVNFLSQHPEYKHVEVL